MCLVMVGCGVCRGERIGLIIVLARLLFEANGCGRGLEGGGSN